MKKFETDICVIAAGPAGLCAAVSAAESGARVAVFEKAAIPGGCANMGMGPFGVESRIQKDLMITLSKEEAFRRFMDYNHWNVDARIVRDYFWKSGDTIDWLEDMGVKFAAPKKNFPDSEATWHVVQPDDGSRPGARAAASMVRALQRRALELGVEFYLETPAYGLIKENGVVCGVKARDKDGEEVEARCKAAIIATGGFGSDAEMIHEYTEYELNETLTTHMVPGVVGDGLKMAWEIGAMKGRIIMETNGLPMVPGFRTGAFNSWVMFVQPRAVMVNRQGERLCDENVLQNNSVSSSIISHQQDKIGIKIVTDEIVKYYIKHGLDVPSEVHHGRAEDFFEQMAECKELNPNDMFIEDTPEALAEKMGIDVEGFLKTIEEYNESCDLHYDDYFCKPRKYLQKLKGKKWYAVYVRAGAYGSLGGIRVNHNYQVIDEQYKPIPGLYAAGSDCCEIFNHIYMYYFPGLTMGFAVNSGRMAGENAANAILDAWEQ